MKVPSSFPRRKGLRFPREGVGYAVWAYHRFALSTADVWKWWLEKPPLGRLANKDKQLGNTVMARHSHIKLQIPLS